MFNATFSNVSAIWWRPFIVVEEARVPGKNQLPWAIDHLRLRIENTFFCNLQSRVQSHAVLVIGLYEVLGNPTTQLTEPSGPSVLDNLIDIYINTDSVVFKNIYI